MKLVFRKTYSCLKCGCLCLLASCANPQVGQPPTQVILISIFYKDKNSVDLLNPDMPESFKEKDLKVISKVEVNGVVKEMNYDEGGIETFWDNEKKSYYFFLTIPSSYAKKPLETYVHLSPTIIDTVTYSFSISPKFKYVPDRIYYNRNLVWDVINATQNNGWPPITIIK